MAGQCNATFDELARSLGNFTCHDAPPIVHLRNPFALSNWTLPVLELMMVTGAALALLFAIRRLRRDNDPTNLALWFATVVYLFVVEIPLYFPNIFGVEDKLGVVFAHNAFTVQFLFERLPLYIIALYPAVTSLAYEIVRSLGVFRDRGIVIGAICVGFVNQCLMWRTVAAGALVPVGVGVLSLPSSIFGGAHPNVTAQAIVLTIGLIVVSAIGLPVLLQQWTRLRGVNAVATPPNEFVGVFGPLYLVVLGFLWASELPAYFEATDGINADGTPTGNLLYAAACFVVAALAVAGVATAGSPRRSVEVDEFALPAQ